MHGKRCLGVCKIFLAAMLALPGCGREEEVYLQEVAQDEYLSEEDGEQTGDTVSKEPEEIYVYVCGEVCSPGVYVLEEDSRICDGIEAAGGMTEDAAKTYLNQAQLLTDGEKIYVPSKEEEARGLPGNPEGGAVSGKVSINHANREELMTLSGIGETKAEAIIAYREANGGFSSLEELMQVEGIKEGTYNKIKEAISL